MSSDLDDSTDDPVVVETWPGVPVRSYARRPATVVDALDRALRRWPSPTAVVDGPRRVTYAELGALVVTAAASLRGRGLVPGDAVAVAAGNSLELAVLLLACARVRLAMVGLDTRLAPAQWTCMVGHTGTRLLLTEQRHPLDTGDVARLDDGYVTVLDRTKDMINRDGTKVFPAEVEELLRAHPAVEDAAVVGVPDPLAGEAVAAYLVLSAPVTGAEVRRWVRERLAAPRVVHVVDELPRNAVGKVDKQALRART